MFFACLSIVSFYVLFLFLLCFRCFLFVFCLCLSLCFLACLFLLLVVIYVFLLLCFPLSCLFSCCLSCFVLLLLFLISFFVFLLCLFVWSSPFFSTLFFLFSVLLALGETTAIFCWLLNAKTLALVLCTLVKFCTLSSPVLVDFCLIWALFLYFCLLFGSFWRSLGSLDHFLRAWGGLGAPGAQKGHFLVTFWSLFERLDPPRPPQEGHFLVTFCKMFSKVRFYVVFW